MAEKFIPKDDLPFVETVARITYCSHFLKERIDLEQEALGSDYKVDPRDWNINPVEPKRSTNLIAILERSKEIIEKCRKKIIRNKGGDARELKLYFDFIYFTYFHEFSEEYDKIISYAHKNGCDPDRIPAGPREAAEGATRDLAVGGGAERGQDAAPAGGEKAALGGRVRDGRGRARPRRAGLPPGDAASADRVHRGAGADLSPGRLPAVVRGDAAACDRGAHRRAAQDRGHPS